MRLALYQPDIPQNTGAAMRLAACLGVGLDVIEPCGFVLDDRRLRRAAMDYLDALDWRRHTSWEDFRAARAVDAAPGRLVLLTVRAVTPYAGFAFDRDDTLLMGRESAGVPDTVRAQTDAELRIPMAAGMRSINVASAAAMVLGEALRQTQGFPEGDR